MPFPAASVSIQPAEEYPVWSHMGSHHHPCTTALHLYIPVRSGPKGFRQASRWQLYVDEYRPECRYGTGRYVVLAPEDVGQSTTRD